MVGKCKGIRTQLKMGSKFQFGSVSLFDDEFDACLLFPR